MVVPLADEWPAIRPFQEAEYPSRSDLGALYQPFRMLPPLSLPRAPRSRASVAKNPSRRFTSLSSTNKIFLPAIIFPNPKSETLKTSAHHFHHSGTEIAEVIIFLFLCVLSGPEKKLNYRNLD